MQRAERRAIKETDRSPIGYIVYLVRVRTHGRDDAMNDGRRGPMQSMRGGPRGEDWGRHDAAASGVGSSGAGRFCLVAVGRNWNSLDAGPRTPEVS